MNHQYDYNEDMCKRFILATLLIIGLQVQAAKITRGPYLQKASDNSMTIRFRTDTATKSFIKYGKESTNLNLRQDNYLFTGEHIIDLNKLEANTRYFYEIYEENSQGRKKLTNTKNIDYSFVTAPTAGKENPVNIWVLGDPGVQSEKEFKSRRLDQWLVKDAFWTYIKKNKIQKPNLILTLGDNAYSFGTDEEFQQGFFDVYKEIFPNTALYTAFGNHDAGIRKKFIAFSARSYPKPRGTYYDIFSLPGKKAYYSFNYGLAHFIVLDSFDSIWEEPLGEIEGTEKVWTRNSKKTNSMLNWLEQDLEKNKSFWTIVIFHHPPYSDEDDNLEKKELWKAWANAYIVPIIEKHKIDLVLSGHIHNYQRTYQLESHLAKENETKITSKEKSEMDEPIKYSYFYNRGETSLDLKLPIYTAQIKSESKNEYKKGDGTIYTIVGSSGSAFKKILPAKNPLFAKKAQEAGSLLLEITKANLQVKFINKNSEVFDEFSIR